jgi:hypothetical protein
MAGKMTLDEAAAIASRVKGEEVDKEIKRRITWRDIIKAMEFKPDASIQAGLAKAVNPGRRKQLQEAMKEN